VVPAAKREFSASTGQSAKKTLGSRYTLSRFQVHTFSVPSTHFLGSKYKGDSGPSTHPMSSPGAVEHRRVMGRPFVPYFLASAWSSRHIWRSLGMQSGTF